jgi:hypothetical protein
MEALAVNQSGVLPCMYHHDGKTLQGEIVQIYADYAVKIRYHESVVGYESHVQATGFRRVSIKNINQISRNNTWQMI